MRLRQQPVAAGSATTRLLHGLAAGAAGTTALNAATFADMVLRARPASTTPEDSVEQLARRAHVAIPGQGDARSNRVSGLGSMLGSTAGVASGGVVGLLLAKETEAWPTTLIVTTVAALIAGNAPMTLLGVTDPQQWTVTDWISDVVPHVAYGLVGGAVLRALRG
ncbi:MAG TPA: hypothetical protein VGO03_04915 [Acidimicrobiia bacterium]|jgi:hypothetical protein